MSKLEANGGWLQLDRYAGPEIPPEEYQSLEYTTYPTDPRTFFAPITSATGDIELGAFGGFGKHDLEREWTPNAEKCPTLIKWLESEKKIARLDAYGLASVAMDCRVGVVSDTEKNVHCLMPKSIWVASTGKR